MTLLPMTKKVDVMDFSSRYLRRLGVATEGPAMQKGEKKAGVSSRRKVRENLYAMPATARNSPSSKEVPQVPLSGQVTMSVEAVACPHVHH
jgi:hypothetical protein